MDETTLAQPRRRRLSFSLWMLLLIVAIFAAVLGAFRSGYERGHAAAVQKQWDATVETHWYAVEDLVVTNAQADFQPLMQEIKSRVAPSSWKKGGLGRIEPFETHLKIVVTNKRQEHREIEYLLDELRQRQRQQLVVE